MSKVDTATFYVMKLLPQVHALAVRHVAGEIDDGAPDVAVAHVDADELARVARDLEQDGSLTAARRAAPDLLHEARIRELGHEVRDGRPGELGPARDVGAADGSEIGERAQDETHVVLSCGLMGRLGWQLHAVPAPPRRRRASIG